MIVCGIDPGANGAVAVLDTEKMCAETMKLDYTNFISVWDKIFAQKYVLEKISSSFGRGSAAMAGNQAKLYGHYMYIKGVMDYNDIVYISPTPPVWMKMFAPLSKDRDKRKTDVYNKMKTLFPTSKFPKYAADAVALAYWGFKQKESEL